MKHKNIHVQHILHKIEQLPDYRIAEIEDFIDFLCQKNYDRELVKAAGKMTESSLNKIWDNPEDAVYDKL